MERNDKMHSAQFRRQTEKKNQRQSNIELLRIVAMIIIVAHHFALHGQFVFPSNSISVNRLWILFILIGGKIGTDVFVLISGYFLVTSKSANTGKVIKLWLQLFFYSAVIFAVSAAFGTVPFRISELIKHIAPVTFSQWWFASTYFVLYILSPYINMLLRTLDNRQYIGFLTLLLFCWCIIPTFTGQAFQSNGLLWFVFLYSLAGYYRLFGIKISLSAGKLISLSFACTLLTFLAAAVFDILGMKIPFFRAHATSFYDMQKIPVLVISVLMVWGFSKLDIRYSRIINTVSSATFGVYLLHDHDIMRIFLWKKVFRNAAYADSRMLIPYSLFVIGLVFTGGTLIELARIYLLENNYRKAITHIAGKADRWIDLLSDTIMRTINK